MATALVIIDVQQGFFTLPQPPHDGERIVERIASLLERARGREVPVFHVQHDGGPGHILEHETPGWRLHPRLAPTDAEHVIEKRHSSAFHGTDLHDLLSGSNIDRIVVAGMQTEYCVDSSCRAAAALGYSVLLARDAHTTLDTPALSAAQIIAHHNLTLGNVFAELAIANDIRF